MSPGSYETRLWAHVPLGCRRSGTKRSFATETNQYVSSLSRSSLASSCLRCLVVRDLMAFDAVYRSITIHADCLAVHFLVFLVTLRALYPAVHSAQCESSFVVIEVSAAPTHGNVTICTIHLRAPGPAELAVVRILLVMASGTLGGSPGKHRSDLNGSVVRLSGCLMTLQADDRLPDHVQV